MQDKKIKFHCETCKKSIVYTVKNGNCGTGYAVDKNGKKHCYECAAKRELSDMKKTGKAVLYYCNDKVTNWSGLLSFSILEKRKNRHNMAGYRYDYWFKVESELWHGYTIGDNTQIAHCKRIKG